MPLKSQSVVSQETSVVNEVLEHQNHDWNEDDAHGVASPYAQPWREQTDHSPDDED